ncbi:hypothetical protein NE542_02250 [Faecalibacillus intestinalis]|jgi:hypothetical protein|uniref:Uncharacterized protein n=1 Tax=Faecalibacillus intestinalis TaxID=1982626 RepID=A0AAP2UCZ7_9FIRM|nr:hypothetical protein [Faecalibacillus intestinalis]MCB8591138.1 hypothetical protein [Faecalibacillus intestinalis]MCB8612018.1 hypothetical protein [Faecalibacillus intestinalis]MCG4679672.1 hypothetical protein [Faecalibacillus intestinalis]MCG4712601.1 hypothetical protein [Faecalibacillus intestinalis]MCG4753814.1 hypothetical protein [Faecalibacillus intestinalis]
MKKVYSLIIEDGIEAITLEENEVLEEILNSLESISNRIDDIQISLLEENEVETSSDLDILEVDF